MCAGNVTKMADERNRWLFTKEQLQDTPSRADGVDPKKELSYRQQAASLIFDIGQKLNVNQNCVSTAVVFVHRFYMFHSFKKYQRSTISTSALFLACKVEEQPRKLEYVVKVAYSMMNQGKSIDSQSQEFQQMSDEVTVHELLILETLGFDVIVEHPHPYVVKCIQLIRASKDLGQTAYFMAHNSLLMTTMCLEYQPSAVACVCIHLACHWKEIEIPKSSDNKHWWEYINSSVDLDMLNRVADEFLKIYESCPSKIKKKMLSQLKGKQAGGQAPRALQSGGESSSSSSSQRPAPSDAQQPLVKPLPPRDKPKAPAQPLPSTTQRQPAALDKPVSFVSASSAGSGSGNKSLPMKTLPVLPPLTISEEKKPSLSVLPPLPRREGDERSKSPRDFSQPEKRSSSSQQRPVSHGHHKNRHGDGHPPPPPHKQKYHDSPTTSSHQLHHHTTSTNQTLTHGGHKRQRNMDGQGHDAKRIKPEQPLQQPPPPPPPHKQTWAAQPQGQKHLGVPQRPDALQQRLHFETARASTSSSSLTVPTAAYSPISPPTPFAAAPPPPPPPLPPSKPPLPPPLPPDSRPM